MPNDNDVPLFDARVLIDELRRLQSYLSTAPTVVSTVSAIRRKALRDAIDQTIHHLNRFSASLDPVRMPEVVLDPSSPEVVGRLIAETLLEQERHALDLVPRFYGSGVYAIDYSGSFGAYAPVSGTDTPLYVGKADPSTHQAATPIEQGERLYSRLNDHRRSIKAAVNLDITDFDCRYLVVKSAWQGTAEIYLINRFLPVWNDETRICYGFGKHGDAPETRANTRSPWDTLHPGRKWATREGNRPYSLSPDEIAARILAHYAAHPPSA